MAGRWVPGAELPAAGSSADRLLDSAERLVALEGVHGVSSRAITLAAGHRNSNAIAYHFGDRRGLLTAVWYRGTVDMDRRRVEEIAALERESGTRDPQALVAVLVRSFTVELVRRTPSYWARFTEAVLSSHPLDPLQGLAVGRTPGEATVVQGLVRTTTHLRALSAQGVEPLASRRIAQVLRMAVTSLACWERDCDAGLLERGTLESLGADLVRTGAAVLTAPTTGPGPRAPDGPGVVVDVRAGVATRPTAW